MSKETWLSTLLEAYSIIDRGVGEAIRRRRKKGGDNPACSEGCDNCCRNLKDIPVYPLELAGIYWYAIEKTTGTVRRKLKQNLLSHSHMAPCPFLIDSACSLYPLRPIACRQFYVFSLRCAEGEDPYYTRQKDVLIPLHDYTNQAVMVMLPFYGITGEKEKLRAIKEKLIHTKARPIQSYNWAELARRMDDFDFNGGAS